MEVHDLIRIIRDSRGPLSMSFGYVTCGSGPIGSAAALPGPTGRHGPDLQKTCEEARSAGPKDFGPAPLRRAIVFFPVPKGMAAKLGRDVTSRGETP